VGLYRNRRDLGSQSITSHWMYQIELVLSTRRKAKFRQTLEFIKGFHFAYLLTGLSIPYNTGRDNDDKRI
jgi:hypothetical protein